MRNEQGVIVSLIVFIVLTLAFGVATYFGAKGFQEQKAALATARSELQSAIAENDTLRADLTNFKTRLGYGFGSADEIINGKDGSEKRVDKNGEEAAVHYAGMTDDVQKALGSDTNFKDAFGKLTAQLAAVNKQIADAVAERDGNIKEAQKQIASAANQKETFDAGVAKLSADHQQNLETARAEYDDLTKQFNEQTKEFDVQKRNARDAIAEAKTETEKERSATQVFDLAGDEALFTVQLAEGRRSEEVKEELLAASALMNQMQIRTARELAQRAAAYQSGKAHNEARESSAIQSKAEEYVSSYKADETKADEDAPEIAYVTPDPGHMPVIDYIDLGAGFTTSAGVSGDRRYVLIAPMPQFSQMLKMFTYNSSDGSSSSSSGGYGNNSNGGYGGNSGYGGGRGGMNGGGYGMGGGMGGRGGMGGMGMGGGGYGMGGMGGNSW